MTAEGRGHDNSPLIDESLSDSENAAKVHDGKVSQLHLVSPMRQQLCLHSLQRPGLEQVVALVQGRLACLEPCQTQQCT